MSAMDKLVADLKSTKENVRFSVTITTEENDILQQLADKYEVSKSSLTSKLLSAAIADLQERTK